MSFAYMPLFTGDYLRDTRHLSMSEHGAYLLMLTYCWDSKGPLPLDERKVCGIVNARSGDEIEAMRRVLSEFFIRMDDGHYNRRMQREIERSEKLSRDRAAAGRKGYEAKAKHLPSKSRAIAKQEPLTPSPSPSLSPSPDQESKALSGKPDHDPALEVLTFFNRATAQRFQPVEANLRMIRARLAEFDVPTVKRVIAAKADQWRDDPKMADYLRPKTIFAASNFASYAGQLPEEEPADAL